VKARGSAADCATLCRFKMLDYSIGKVTLKFFIY